MAVELREHDRRLSGLHRTVGALSTDVGQHKTDIASIRLEVQGAREDIKEIKDELTWLRRGIWTAASALIGFMLTLGGLIIAITNHG